MEKSLRSNDQSDSTGVARPRRGWFTILVGLIGGGLLAAMIALGLAFVVLLTPVSGYLGLGGEFDGLWLLGLPVYALPSGIIGGLVLGSTWKWKYCYRIAWLWASLPAALYFFTNAWDNEMSKNPRDVFISTFVISGCMALSAAISLKLIGQCFSAFEKYFVRDR